VKPKSRIRWGRVLAGALLSETAVIVALLAVTTIYRLLISPGRTAAEYQAFSELAGYYVAPAGAGLATFLSALWVARKLTSDFIANGTLVGVAGVILTAGLVFVARPEDRLMYMVSFIIRIVAAYLGGVAAQRNFTRRSKPASALSVGEVG
jgi:hypothetical protein